MREVLFRVRQLFSRPWVARWWVVLAGVGLALTWLPLLEQPGYELSTGLCLLLTFPGAGLALACARAPRSDPWASALVLGSVTLPALAMATLKTLLFTPCDPFGDLGFLPLLLVPTSALVGAAAALAKRVASRWWAQALLYWGVVSASALSTVLPLVLGPQVFAYNHFGGFLPGPLYDEAVTVPAALWWFRLATLCLAFAVGAWAARKRGLAVVAFATFGLLEFNGVGFGFRMSDAALAQALGGEVETEALVLHYPQGLSDEEVSRVLGDLRFRHHQIVTFFGEPPPGKVTVWLYRSAEDKQRLVGAAQTQFAKPWRREIHVNGLGFPHPVIKHELVHALAAPWGRPPFGIAASFGGLLPHVGVIEGFAVAADNPVDELTLHQWAAAMKKKGLLPDVNALMSAQGFYSAPPSRAYTTAGSFVRYLGETTGQEKLRALYLDGDFERVFGQPLSVLARQYEAFLDQVPLEPDAVNQAFGRFRRGSLFERPCAREVGRLLSEAGAALPGEPARALGLLSRCRKLQPQEPSHLLSEANTLRRLGLENASQALLDAELVRLSDEPSPWADAALARADLAAQGGAPDVARGLWEQIIARHVSPALERTALVRLDGVELEAVQRYFQPGDDGVKLFLLARAADRAPERWSVRYLLGRRLQQSGEAGAALPVLEALLEEPGLPRAVAQETAVLALQAAFALGRCDTVSRWASTGRFGTAFDARAADWVARCAFASPTP